MHHSVNPSRLSFDLTKPITTCSLIKRDLNRNVIIWTFEAYQDMTKDWSYEIRIKSGRYYSDINAITPYITNIEGKSLKHYNDQIIAIIDRKLKLGYKYLADFDNVDDLPTYNTDANNLCKPMKCQPFKERRFVQGMLGQGKINGVRAIVMYSPEPTSTDLFSKARNVKILSKEGLRYDIKHIEDVFERIYESEEYRDLVFDGEIYIPNERVTTIGGAARNSKNPLHSRLKFIIFDLAIPEVIQIDRLAILSDIARIHPMFDLGIIDIEDHIDTDVTKVVSILGHETFNNVEHCIPFMEKMISHGFEGAVFRHPTVEYKFGSRPTTMVKLKKSMDGEFKIIDIILTRGVSNVGVSLTFILQNDIDTQTFSCECVGTVSEKEEIFANRDSNIGLYATVKYYERTKYDLPFHANVLGIRNYE